MTRRTRRCTLQGCSSLLAVALLLPPPLAGTALAQGSAPAPAAASAVPAAASQGPGPSPTVILAPGVAGDVATYAADPARDPAVPTDRLVALLRQKVKYVFVLFQENRSFDSYFGTYRGANGLFSDGGSSPVPRGDAHTPGFVQALPALEGPATSIRPFRIGPNQHAADLDDVDHSHARMAAKMDLAGGTGAARMDRFAAVEAAKYNVNGATTLKGRQYGELAMAYEDCDTVPFLWNYANRFVLFDNIFQTVVGPSSPNALAMIAGQSGETQWVKHGSDPFVPGTPSSFQVPVVGDPVPFWGSPADPARAADKQPQNPYGEGYGLAASGQSPNQTYASLPLTLAGADVKRQMAADADAARNQADIGADIPAVAAAGRPTIPWGWYQEGFDAEAAEGLFHTPGNGSRNPADTTPSPLGNPLAKVGTQAPAGGDTHNSYIAHHNGPQYFGYIADNPEETLREHGLGDFFADMDKRALPASGGVFYVRGGYQNIQHLTPWVDGLGADEARAVTAGFQGDDDHPAYSDSQISEALIAREVNAVARSPYWGQSAIVITYDESEGDYDHVPPRILSFDPVGLPDSRGPRIPLLVISPYARAHVVSREEGDHNSVIRLINALFGLPALADLPDEAAARKAAGTDHRFDGPNGTPNADLGPHDGAANDADTGALLSAFDPGRLDGSRPALPASYAELPDAEVEAMPALGNEGCRRLGLQTEDRVQGIVNTIPADFNPRPGTFPGQGTTRLDSP